MSDVLARIAHDAAAPLPGIRPRASSRFDLLPEMRADAGAPLGAFTWADLFTPPEAEGGDEVAAAARLYRSVDGAVTLPAGAASEGDGVDDAIAPEAPPPRAPHAPSDAGARNDPAQPAGALPTPEALPAHAADAHALAGDEPTHVTQTAQAVTRTAHAEMQPADAVTRPMHATEPAHSVTQTTHAVAQSAAEQHEAEQHEAEQHEAEQHAVDQHVVEQRAIAANAAPPSTERRPGESSAGEPSAGERGSGASAPDAASPADDASHTVRARTAPAHPAAAPTEAPRVAAARAAAPQAAAEHRAPADAAAPQDSAHAATERTAPPPVAAPPGGPSRDASERLARDADRVALDETRSAEASPAGVIGREPHDIARATPRASPPAPDITPLSGAAQAAFGSFASVQGDRSEAGASASPAQPLQRAEVGRPPAGAADVRATEHDVAAATNDRRAAAAEGRIGGVADRGTPDRARGARSRDTVAGGTGGMAVVSGSADAGRGDAAEHAPASEPHSAAIDAAPREAPLADTASSGAIRSRTAAPFDAIGRSATSPDVQRIEPAAAEIAAASPHRVEAVTTRVRPAEPMSPRTDAASAAVVPQDPTDAGVARPAHAERSEFSSPAQPPAASSPSAQRSASSSPSAERPTPSSPAEHPAPLRATEMRAHAEQPTSRAPDVAASPHVLHVDAEDERQRFGPAPPAAAGAGDGERAVVPFSGTPPNDAAPTQAPQSLRERSAPAGEAPWAVTDATHVPSSHAMQPDVSPVQRFAADRRVSPRAMADDTGDPIETPATRAAETPDVGAHARADVVQPLQLRRAGASSAPDAGAANVTSAVDVAGVSPALSAARDAAETHAIPATAGAGDDERTSISAPDAADAAPVRTTHTNANADDAPPFAVANEAHGAAAPAIESLLARATHDAYGTVGAAPREPDAPQLPTTSPSSSTASSSSLSAGSGSRPLASPPSSTVEPSSSTAPPSSFPPSPRLHSPDPSLSVSSSSADSAPHAAASADTIRRVAQRVAGNHGSAPAPPSSDPPQPAETIVTQRATPPSAARAELRAPHVVVTPRPDVPSTDDAARALVTSHEADESGYASPGVTPLRTPAVVPTGEEFPDGPTPAPGITDATMQRATSSTAPAIASPIAPPIVPAFAPAAHQTPPQPTGVHDAAANVRRGPAASEAHLEFERTIARSDASAGLPRSDSSADTSRSDVSPFDVPRSDVSRSHVARSDIASDASSSGVARPERSRSGASPDVSRSDAAGVSRSGMVHSAGPRSDASLTLSRSDVPHSDAPSGVSHPGAARSGAPRPGAAHSDPSPDAPRFDVAPSPASSVPRIAAHVSREPARVEPARLGIDAVARGAVAGEALRAPSDAHLPAGAHGTALAPASQHATHDAPDARATEAPLQRMTPAAASSAAAAGDASAGAHARPHHGANRAGPPQLDAAPNPVDGALRPRPVAHDARRDGDDVPLHASSPVSTARNVASTSRDALRSSAPEARAAVPRQAAAHGPDDARTRADSSSSPPESAGHGRYALAALARDRVPRAALRAPEVGNANANAHAEPGVVPLRAAAAARAASATPREGEQIVRVTIGRIRVDAPGATGAAPSKPFSRPRPSLTLDEYARRRGTAP